MAKRCGAGKVTSAEEVEAGTGSSVCGAAMGMAAALDRAGGG
jgi:hypothetical protein